MRDVVRILRGHCVNLSVGAAAVAFVAAVNGVVPGVPGLALGAASAQPVGVVTVTGVAPNHSSARIYYQPVPGAKDYRIYDISAPTNVKYAGLVHLTADPACPGDASCSHRFALETDG